MNTVFSVMQKIGSRVEVQRAKSKRGREKVERRFRRAGIMPDQIANIGRQFRQLSVVPTNSLDIDLGFTSEGIGTATTFPEGDPNGFRIEYQCKVTKAWIGTPSDKTTLATTAGALLERAGVLATRNLGTRFRIIRPTPGARAVHRIAARVSKAGSVELYKWST